MASVADLDRTLYQVPQTSPVVQLICKTAFDNLTDSEKRYAALVASACWRGALICTLQTSPESPYIFAMFRHAFDGACFKTSNWAPFNHDGVSSEPHSHVELEARDLQTRQEGQHVGQHDEQSNQQRWEQGHDRQRHVQNSVAGGEVDQAIPILDLEGCIRQNGGDNGHECGRPLLHDSHHPHAPERFADSGILRVWQTAELKQSYVREHGEFGADDRLDAQRAQEFGEEYRHVGSRGRKVGLQTSIIHERTGQRSAHVQEGAVVVEVAHLACSGEAHAVVGGENVEFNVDAPEIAWRV